MQPKQIGRYTSDQWSIVDVNVLDNMDLIYRSRGPGATIITKG